MVSFGALSILLTLSKPSSEFDSMAPSQPLSATTPTKVSSGAFLAFCEAEKESIRKQGIFFTNPEEARNFIAKTLAERWNALSPEKKLGKSFGYLKKKHIISQTSTRNNKEI